MFDDLRNPDRPKQDVIYLTLFNVNFLSIMQNVKPQKLSTPVCFISYIFFLNQNICVCTLDILL